MSSRRTRPPVPTHGERKLVTVLFVDLTGYTALSASLDPEEVFGFLRPGILALQRIVEGYGGTVPQIMGDGFMAVFGVPTAHEDDAERAVRAALAVREHVAELNVGRRGLRFPPVHSGVNSGEVMVAAADEAAGFAVVGDTVNTASRLADLAPGGRILVDERTRGRTAHAVRFGARRDRHAKGKPQPIPTYEAVGLRLAPPPRRRGSSRVFVDRDEAFARIGEELLAAAGSSRSRTLVVTGEAGVGKSRLAAELRRRRVGHVLIGRCPTLEQPLPLHALAEAVGAGLGLAPGATREEVKAATERLAPAVPRSERRAFARGLRLLLGGERIPERQARGSVSDAEIGARTALSAIASKRPVVVVLDDVHRGDTDLLRLLRTIDRSPWPAPILFLALGRMASGLAGLPRLRLEALGADDMRTLAHHVLGYGLPEEALEHTVGRAGGNPLFLEETIGMLAEAGALDRRGTAWSAADMERLRGLPSSIRLLIAARLDGLPVAEKEVLQSAAVSGDAAWDGLLEVLGPGPDVASALRSLERRGLLLRRPRSQIPGQVEYEVKHVLIGEVAYESLPRAERAQRHLAVARWLRAQAPRPSEEPVPLLAHHYDRAWSLAHSRTGSAPERETARLAVRYLARWAARTFAYQARLAESIYQRALAIARTSGAVEPKVEADLLIGHAESLLEMGRHREASVDATEARALAKRLGDRRRMAQAQLALGRTEADRGRMSMARRALAQAREGFEAEGDLRGQALALHRISETWSQANYARGIEALEDSYRLFSRARDRWGQGLVAQDLAYLLTTSGGPRFRRWFERADRLAGDEGDVRSRALLARTAGYAAYYRGEYGEAIASMRLARPLAERCGDRYAEADAVLTLALAEATVGSPQTAGELAEDLLQLADDVESTRLHVLALLAAARAALRAGDPGLAARRLGAARRVAERRRMGTTRVDVDVVEALVRLDRGAFSSVPALASRIRPAVRRNGWTLWEPLAPLIRGRAALGSGRPGHARVNLARAAALAGKAEATGHERLARLLLAQCDLLERRAPVTWDAGQDVEESAIELENRGLGELLDGRYDRAWSAFEVAASRWETLGATVWHARALRMGADAVRADGDPRSAAALERRSDRLLDRLRTPLADRAGILTVERRGSPTTAATAIRSFA